MQQHFQLWRDNLVLICDDLSKNDHKCLGKIKKNLSGNHFSPRIFFKQSHERMFKRATPIGTCQSTVSNTFDQTQHEEFCQAFMKYLKPFNEAISSPAEFKEELKEFPLL